MATTVAQQLVESCRFLKIENIPDVFRERHQAVIDRITGMASEAMNAKVMMMLMTHQSDGNHLEFMVRTYHNTDPGISSNIFQMTYTLGMIHGPDRSVHTTCWPSFCVDNAGESQRRMIARLRKFMDEPITIRNCASGPFHCEIGAITPQSECLAFNVALAAGHLP